MRNVNQNVFTFLENQATSYVIARRGKLCSDIGYTSLKSSHMCKEAATAFGKVMEEALSKTLKGWCIFQNNEVYWDVPGAGLWKEESQEICLIDDSFPWVERGKISLHIMQGSGAGTYNT